MQITAKCNFHLGLRNDEEIIHRGQTFTPPGTGIMNAAEHARSLINTGMCCAPSDFAKYESKSEAGHAWALGEVAKLDAERAAREAAKVARAS